jgi:hypothetical protein
VSKSPAERLFEARDAYRSAVVMASLMVATPVVRTLTTWRLRTPSTYLTSGSLTVLGLGVLAFLIRRRRRPETTHALALTLMMTVPLLFLVPHLFVRWATLGHPWEAFQVGSFLLAGSAMIIPRFFALGAAFNVIVLADVLLGMHLQRRMGVPPELQPIAEPAITVLFFFVGMALVGLRAWRHRLIERHLRLEGEVLAMRRSADRLQSVRRSFEALLQRITGELERLAAQAEGKPFEQIERSIDRLMGTTRKLGDLSPPTEVSSIDAEEDLYARDAQRGATVLAAIFAIGCPTFAVVFSDLPLGPLPWLLLCDGGLGLVALLALLATRRRPSWKRGTAWFIVLTVPWFCLVAYNTTLYPHQTRPFHLFLVPKMIMVCMTLVVSRNLWLGRILNAALCLEAVVLFYVFRLGALQDRVSPTEPWQTLLYGALGIALLSLAEERRLASLRVLRAEAEQAALLRSATIYVALRDQLNSPLQSLVLNASLLGGQAELGSAIDQLVALARQLPEERAVERSGLVDVSLDGAAELRRRVD